MNVAVAMVVLAGIAMAVIWLPAYPPPRDPHMRAMDELGRRRRCDSCGAPLDALGSCTGCCAGEVWES